MAARVFSRRFSGSARAAAKTVQPPIQSYSLAGKYSGAAYSAALSKSENTLSALESDLQKVKQVLNSDAKLQEFISNPTLSHADKEAGVEALLKNTKEATTKQLLEVLNENGRLADAGKVIEEFEQIMSAHRGEVTITVTSAAPLDSSTQSRLEKSLKNSAAAQTGKSCKVTNHVNPAILGGLLIDFGDKTIDLSVQSKVQKLNTLLQDSV